jgi:hypothetical protein
VLVLKHNVGGNASGNGAAKYAGHVQCYRPPMLCLGLQAAQRNQAPRFESIP